MSQQRASMQLRPSGSTSQFYSPQRDLAYFYPTFMSEAISGLMAARRPPDLDQLLDDSGITEESLGEAAGRYAKAHQQFVNCPEVKTAFDALTANGWYEVPILARLVLLARLGDMLTGGFFVAVRDTTRLGEEPPQIKDLADLVAAGRVVSEHLTGSAVTFLEDDQKDLKIASLESELTFVRDALATQTKMTKDSMAKAGASSRERRIEQAQSAKLWGLITTERDTLRGELTWFQSAGIFPLLWTWLRRKLGFELSPESAMTKSPACAAEQKDSSS